MARNVDVVTVAGLKVDYVERPLGVENRYPRFSWRLESNERNVLQGAYRILVASEESILANGRGDLWDSGKIESRKSIGVRYAGRALSSRKRCWWNVQVWDEKGRASPPSASSWWEMGLLDANDWVAEWIAAEDPVARADRTAGLSWIWDRATTDVLVPRQFRCKFILSAPSLGGEYFAGVSGAFGNVYNVWIDGNPVDRGPQSGSLGQWLHLQPMFPGEHLIAVEVTPLAAPHFVSEPSRADGFTFFARLMLESGERFRIGRASSWKVATGENGKWYLSSYDDEAWQSAQPAGVCGYQPWPAGPAMYLRRAFCLSRLARSARLYVTALGAYEARLNGRRVGNALLTPEASQYDKRVLYRVYDVTDQVLEGANVLGLIVGDGWYGSAEGRFEWGSPPRRVLAQLEVILVDGSREVIGTGPGWRTEESPIRVSQIRVGETYDARYEQPGWDAVEFVDCRWREAEISAEPHCRLVSQTNPPIKVIRVLKPRTIFQSISGTYVFDFGLNFAGWCRLHAKGPEGTRIELRFAELLTPSGQVQTSYDLNMGDPKRDVFILRGDPSGETFEPRFTYRGFRYVEVSGLPEAPTCESMEGVVLHTDLEMTGQLRVCNPLIEAIWKLTVQTQCHNFVGIPTDCPSREQRGWMNDSGSFWDAACFNMDVCAFSSRHLDNAVDGQLANGAFPQFAPWPRKFASIMSGPPGWGDGGVVLAWMTWHRYGDTSIIERNWHAMNRYLQFIMDNNPDYLWRNKRGADYGDWLAPDQVTLDSQSARATSKELVGTAYWAHSADLLAQMASAIGRAEDFARLCDVFDRVRKAFIEKYVTSDGLVGDGSQTSYVLSLKFGLLPEDIRGRAAQRLADDVRRRGIALTTGFLGTPLILDVLEEAGFVELAYGLLLRTDYPSWGYMLRNGATTLWESWSGEIEQDNRTVNLSQNHFALGSICGFLFRRVAGIDAGAPGFEVVIVRPALDPRVMRGGGDYDSVRGRISVDWSQIPNTGFALDVAIPANTIARIFLPAPRGSQIEEGGQQISHSRGIRSVNAFDHEVLVEVGSGRYSFFVRR